MISCDYLIIGSGFAGTGLKYKLMGKTILIDKNPFQYKIGESHVPSLIQADQGLFSLIPKIMEMKSYTRKLGTVFCDSYHGKYASNFSTPLGFAFAWHCEREEIEKLLAKELSIEIRQETIVHIDLSRNRVTTDKNTYHFKKYILDCSGPAMVIANKLNLVRPVEQFKGMMAQWSYWTIDHVKEGMDSWAHWTVINKIAKDSWMWQIPIYNSSILSMGLLHKGEALSKDDFLKHVKPYAAACYQLTSILENPGRAIKPYMKDFHSRLHYSRRSQQCCGKNWILVGDAYCFADPVYSTGSGVAMLEAITIANILNKNEGKFDHSWYEKRCNALLKTVIEGIGTWYSGTAFDKHVNKRINRTILQGGFSSYFRPSRITEDAKRLQKDNLDVFNPSKPFWRDKTRVYYFDKNLFIKGKGSLSLLNVDKPIPVTNSAVQRFIKNKILGRKFSFYDLYLSVELNLLTVKDKTDFWKLVQWMEHSRSKSTLKDRLYYFHPEKYENIPGALKLGDEGHHLTISHLSSMKFFDGLKGRIYFGKELMEMARHLPDGFSETQKDLKSFLMKFYRLDTFGQDYCFFSK